MPLLAGVCRANLYKEKQDKDQEDKEDPREAAPSALCYCMFITPFFLRHAVGAGARKMVMLVVIR